LFNFQHIYNRTTTLNDVYRHYAPRNKIRKNDDIEEFDGEVTGYAMQAPLPSNGKVGIYEPHEGRLQKQLQNIARCMKDL